jgi:anti-sigma factor RsiW
MSDRPITDRLLGPEGPELGCDECFEHLDRYVEAEIAGGEPFEASRAMAAHLEGCPACAEEYESLKALISEPGA